MSQKSKLLSREMIKFDIKKIEKNASFKYILNFVLLQKPRVVVVSAETKAILGMVDKFYWRPEDLYFYRINDAKISCNNIIHAGIHYLLAMRYGSKQKDRPSFVLLCEALASLAEYYFKLESFLVVGLDKTLENYISRLISTGTTYFDRSKSGSKVMKIFNESLENPYHAFREATIEMHGFYLYMYDISIQRQAGRSFKIENFLERALGLKYGPVIYDYDLSNNILFAMNCAKKSNPEDLALVNEDFLLALGNEGS